MWLIKALVHPSDSTHILINALSETRYNVR